MQALLIFKLQTQQTACILNLTVATAPKKLTVATALKKLTVAERPWHDRRLSCVHMHETPTPRPSTPPRPQHSSLPYPHTDPSCIRVRHAQLDPVLTEASASPRTDASPCSWRAPPQQCRGQHLPQVGAVRWEEPAPAMGARGATATASTIHPIVRHRTARAPPGQPRHRRRRRRRR